MLLVEGCFAMRACIKSTLHLLHLAPPAHTSMVVLHTRLQTRRFQMTTVEGTGGGTRCAAPAAPALVGPGSNLPAARGRQMRKLHAVLWLGMCTLARCACSTRDVHAKVLCALWSGLCRRGRTRRTRRPWRT